MTPKKQHQNRQIKI